MAAVGALRQTGGSDAFSRRDNPVAVQIVLLELRHLFRGPVFGKLGHGNLEVGVGIALAKPLGQIGGQVLVGSFRRAEQPLGQLTAVDPAAAVRIGLIELVSQVAKLAGIQAPVAVGVVAEEYASGKVIDLAVTGVAPDLSVLFFAGASLGVFLSLPGLGS